MKNKRKLERFNLKAPAKIIPIDSGRKKSQFDLVTSNVCAGGAFFHTSHSLPEGTQVDVDVVLPLDRLEIIRDSSKQIHLSICGKVVRSEADGIAVCFHKDYEICQLDSSAQTQKNEKYA